MIPLLHDFEGETVLVVGGGPVGARKARSFAREARTVVASPAFADRDFGDAELVRAAPAPGEVADWVDRLGPALVVAATDDDAVNEAAERAAREAGALVNRADRSGGRDAGSVVVPATVRDAPVVAAVATGGAAPALSKELRRRIEAEIPDFLERMASINEAGVTIVGSLQRLSKAELGRLGDEIDRVWQDVQWGANVESALARMERRTGSPMVSRSMTLIRNAMAASGNIGPVLHIAADEAQEIRRLQVLKAFDFPVFDFFDHCFLEVFKLVHDGLAGPRQVLAVGVGPVVDDAREVATVEEVGGLDGGEDEVAVGGAAVAAAVVEALAGANAGVDRLAVESGRHGPGWAPPAHSPYGAPGVATAASQSSSRQVWPSSWSTSGSPHSHSPTNSERGIAALHSQSG